MHIVLLKCPRVQIAFLKFTSCDNQALVGVYSNCCCSCAFESEIIKISQWSHKMYSNNILNSQESMTILNACTKKSGNLLNTPRKFRIQLSIIWSNYSCILFYFMVNLENLKHFNVSFSLSFFSLSPSIIINYIYIYIYTLYIYIYIIIYIYIYIYIYI